MCEAAVSRPLSNFHLGLTMSTHIRLALLLVCAVTLAACGDSAPPPAPTTAGPAAGTAPAVQQEQPAAPLSTETAEELLARANEALAADRLFEPAGDNALEYYLSAMARAEAQAAEGDGQEKATRRLSDAMATADLVTQTKLAISDILPYGLVWVERAINNDSRPEAARVLALLERAQPGASSLQRLREQLAEAEVAAEREAARAVAAAVAAEARAAEAATAPAEPPAAEPVQPAATPAPRPTAPPVAATPTPATTAPAPAPAPTTAPAALPPGATPKLMSQPELRYPTRALRRSTEGYVVVTFTINPDGTTSNVNATRAVPRGLFEREAERIVAGLKFQPPGRPIQSERQIDFKIQ